MDYTYWPLVHTANGKLFGGIEEQSFCQERAEEPTGQGAGVDPENNILICARDQ